MCDIWRTTETRELTLADLAPHLASIRELRVQWVVFSGGEPLMNPGLFALASALREMNIRITLLTTGLLLEKYATQIRDTIDEVIVSLDGPAAIHNEIRRVPRAFETMAAGISAVRSLAPNVPIRARTTIQRANHLHLRDTVRAALALGLNSISFLAADVTSTAFNRELVWPQARQAQIALTQDETLALEKEVEALIREHIQEIATGFIAESSNKLRRIVRHFRAQLGLETPIAPRCNAPWVSAVIEANGEIRPCFFHAPIGKLGDADLKQALNSTKALNFRTELQIESNAVCQRCVCSLYRRESDPPDVFLGDPSASGKL
jgi:MoaA/NifB/PqqE/SkfB family radical SAM enzyme